MISTLTDSSWYSLPIPTPPRALRIYIAGALSSKENTSRNPSKVVVDYIQNVSAMVKAASGVRRKGHFPYVPGLDFVMGMVVGDWEEKDYRELGMAFLEVCDAILITSWSWGVEQEVIRARELGLTVYNCLEEIPSLGSWKI